MGTANDNGGFDFSALDINDQSFTSRMDQSVQFRVKFNKGNVEETYGKLLEFRTALESEGSLSLNLALEADSLMGCNGELVRTYFDVSTKAKRYRIAMETIDAGLLGVIIAVAIALTGMIVHFIRYMFYTPSGSSGGGGSGIYVRVERSEKAEKARDEWTAKWRASNERVKKSTDEFLKGVEELMNRSPAEHRLHMLLDSLNGLDFDILEYGAVTEHVKKYVDFNKRFDVINALDHFGKLATQWYEEWSDRAAKLTDETALEGFKKAAEDAMSGLEHRAWQTDGDSLATWMHVEVAIAMTRKNQKRWTTDEMLNGLEHVEKTIPLAQYVMLRSNQENQLKGLKTDTETMVKKLEEAKQRMDTISVAEKATLTMYHGWMVRQHKRMGTAFNGIVAFNKYYKTYIDLGETVRKLTDAAFDILKERQKATPGSSKPQGSRTVIDMGEVEEVQKELKAIPGPQ